MTNESHDEFEDSGETFDANRIVARADADKAWADKFELPQSEEMENERARQVGESESGSPPERGCFLLALIAVVVFVSIALLAAVLWLTYPNG